jgi:hypothetical protein
MNWQLKKKQGLKFSQEPLAYFPIRSSECTRMASFNVLEKLITGLFFPNNSDSDYSDKS